MFLAVDLLSKGSPAAMEWQTKPILSQLPLFTAWLDQLSLTSLFLLFLLAAVLLKLAQSLVDVSGFREHGHLWRPGQRRRHLPDPQPDPQPHLSLREPLPGGGSHLLRQWGPGSCGCPDQYGQFLHHEPVDGGHLSHRAGGALPLAAAGGGGHGRGLTLVQRELLPRVRQRGFRGTQIGVAISTRIVEDIQGLRLLHSSGQLDQADRNMRSRMGELEENSIAQGKLGAVVGPITVFLPMAMIALIAALSLLVFGARSSGVLPSLATFVVALQRLNGSFGAVANNFPNLNANAAALNRLNEILDHSDKEFRRGVEFPSQV